MPFAQHQASWQGAWLSRASCFFSPLPHTRHVSRTPLPPKHTHTLSHSLTLWHASALSRTPPGCLLAAGGRSLSTRSKPKLPALGLVVLQAGAVSEAACEHSQAGRQTCVRCSHPWGEFRQLRQSRQLGPWSAPRLRLCHQTVATRCRATQPHCPTPCTPSTKTHAHPRALPFLV